MGDAVGLAVTRAAGPHTCPPEYPFSRVRFAKRRVLFTPTTKWGTLPQLYTNTVSKPRIATRECGGNLIEAPTYTDRFRFTSTRSPAGAASSIARWIALWSYPANVGGCGGGTPGGCGGVMCSMVKVTKPLKLPEYDPIATRYDWPADTSSCTSEYPAWQPVCPHPSPLHTSCSPVASLNTARSVSSPSPAEALVQVDSCRNAAASGLSRTQKRSPTPPKNVCSHWLGLYAYTLICVRTRRPLVPPAGGVSVDCTAAESMSKV